MTQSTIIDEVRAGNETALARLGSGKALFANAGGELETAAILATAADAERTAHETFSKLAASETDPRLEAFFEAVATEEDDHRRHIRERLDEEPVEPDVLPAMHRYLRSLDDPIERLGGFVGRTLVARESAGPTIGFFVGNADPDAADLFRSLRADTDDQLERGLELLDSVCRTPEDRQRAFEAASDTIQAAYDDYVDTLESFGVSPKPVC